MTITDIEKRLGRPRTVEGRAVYEALLCAAEQCIGEYGAADVSVMQIARAAGATDKMINYYFGSKEHLMFAVMKRAQREMREELDELRATLLQKGRGNPTLRLVRLYAIFARKHGGCAKFYPIRNPELRRAFYLLLRPVNLKLAEILRDLVKAGVYSPALNLRHATFTLANLISAPQIFAFALPMHDLTPDDLQSDAWITHVASMLDQQFRNPQGVTADSELEAVETDLTAHQSFDRQGSDQVVPSGCVEIHEIAPARALQPVS